MTMSKIQIYMHNRHCAIFKKFDLNRAMNRDVLLAEGTLKLTICSAQHVYVDYKHGAAESEWRAREKKSKNHGSGVDEDVLVYA